VIQREDDRPESIRVRMRAYEEAAQQLTEYYVRSDRLVPVRASGTPAQILVDSLQALSEHFPRRGGRAGAARQA
jgi:adenylate kinase